MKPITLTGILWVVLGVLALAYPGISYTRQDKVLDVGPIHATAETHEQIPLPTILGGLAFVGGVVLLLVMGARQKSYRKELKKASAPTATVAFGKRDKNKKRKTI